MGPVVRTTSLLPTILDRIFGDNVNERQIKQLVELLGGEIHNRLASSLSKEFVALAEVESAEARVLDLTRQIATLKAEKDGITEGFARREREVEHKVGLLRNEMEQTEKNRQSEFALKVQEAKLAAREEGLKEREKAFAERMDFMTKRFTDEVGYLKDMVAQVLERIPDAAILGTKSL